MNNMNFEQFKHWVAFQLNLKEQIAGKIQEASEQSHLHDDLGFDSLAIVDLVCTVEAEFDVDIDPNGLNTTDYTLGSLWKTTQTEAA